MSRAIAIVLLTFVLLTLLGGVTQLVGAEMLSIDAAAIVVLHVALYERRPLFGRTEGLTLMRGRVELPGAITALAVGYLADLLSGGTKGVLAFALALLYVCARLLSRQISLVGTLAQCVLAAIASLLVSFAALMVRWTAGVPPDLAIVPVLLSQAALTGAVAPPLIRLIRAVDARLGREGPERGLLHRG